MKTRINNQQLIKEAQAVSVQPLLEKQRSHTPVYQESFKPQINKKSQKMRQEKAPIFSAERYQKDLADRNQKREMALLKRQHELELKELEEFEDIARNYLHKGTQNYRIDLDSFNKQYQEKMENLATKKHQKQLEKDKEFEQLTFQPDINKKSRRIAGNSLQVSQMRANSSVQTFGSVLGNQREQAQTQQQPVGSPKQPETLRQGDAEDKPVLYTYNEQSVGKILTVNTHFEQDAVPRITEYYSEKRSVTPDAATQSTRKNAALSKYLNGGAQKAQNPVQTQKELHAASSKQLVAQRVNETFSILKLQNVSCTK